MITPQSNNEDLLIETPATISAANLGAKFSDEWKSIERNQVFWRWATCSGFVLVLLCGFFLCQTFAAKWESTVGGFTDLSKNEQNFNHGLQARQAALQARLAETKRQGDALEFKLKTSYAVHGQLRSAVDNYLQGHKRNAESSELHLLRAELIKAALVSRVAKDEHLSAGIR